MANVHQPARPERPRRQWERLAAVAATMALLASFLVVLPASAGNCNYAYLTVYENANGGGASRTICYADNFSNIGTQWPSPGNFHCGVFNTTWNDCITSVTYWESSFPIDTAVCLWQNSSYGGNGLRVLSHQTNYNLPAWLNEQTTSIEWGNACLNSGVATPP